MSGWSADQVPDQTGRRVLVTGAGSGVARATALDLAGRGASLLLADRDLDALADVVRHADAAGPQRPASLPLDLADLDSVRDVAGEVEALVGGRLDLVVIDDAGGRERTDAGVPPVLAARAVGPFALVARLRLALGAGHGRVVTVVPPTYRLARTVPSGQSTAPERTAGAPTVDPVDPVDPVEPVEPADREHEPLLRRTAWAAPAESALAAMLLALELAERARRHEAGFRSLVAIAGIDVGEAVERTERVRRGRGPRILDAALGMLEQRGDLAHLPVLMAATDELPSGTVVGLSGALGLGREPRILGTPRQARDRDQRERLWQLARDLSGEALW